MGRKRKKPKIKKLEDDDIFGIKFEIEENAKEVFVDYLEQMPAIPSNDWDKDSMSDHPPADLQPSNKQSPYPNHLEIDLHGFHLAEAIFHLDEKIRECLAHGPRIVHLKVITGKGRHSGPAGSVLAREIHEHVSRQYRKQIVRIDESPAAVTLDGLPIRGYFVVVLKRTGA